jgi:MFS transporter, FHS family, glucose/mannose:H+ symporter
MSRRDPPARAVTVAGFAVFVLLGVVIASYGPSIPHITHRFQLSASVAGLIVTANFMGEVIGLLSMGLTHARWRLGRRLAVGTMLFGVGLLAAAAAPTWPLLLFGVFVLGIGAGGLVVLVNLYFATRFGRRSPAMLSLVNTAYGTGNFIGPAAVALTSGYSIVFGVVGVGVLACVGFLGRAEDEVLGRDVAPPPLSRRTVGLVVAFALMLLVYEGIEAGVGTWEATDLISFGSSVQFAAAATSLFWGAFTVGRVLTAPLAVRWSPQRLLVPAFAISVVLLIGIRLQIAPPLLFALVGLCAAPIFPVAVSWMTRVIPNATTLTTYAILGAVIGSAVVPAGLGALIGLAGAAQLPLGVATCSLASLGMVGVITLRLRR